jgi:hypothetical protein
MSTSLVGYADKRFWMHNAVAEVWFSVFAKQVVRRRTTERWLIAFAGEAQNALDARWIDGIATGGFDQYVGEEQRTLFLGVLAAVNKELLDQAAQASVVEVDGFAATSEFLVAELSMLENVFLRPQRVPMPPNVFSPAGGWRPA